MKAGEKSRRVRAGEPAQPVIQLIASTGDAVDPDDWYSGYAAALAQIWRLHHDGQRIRHILTAGGVTLKHFEECGVDEYDLAAIREAVIGRRRWG